MAVLSSTWSIYLRYLRTLQETPPRWLLLSPALVVGLVMVTFFIRSLFVPYLGIDVAYVQGRWIVSQIDKNGAAYRDDIRSGDEVVAVNRRPPDEIAHGMLYIGAYHIHSVAVTDPAGRLIRSSSADGPVPISALDESIGLFTVSSAFWLVGSLSFLRRPRSKPAIYLYLMSQVVALAPVASLGSIRSWPEAREIEVVALVLTPWIVVRFFLEFPFERHARLFGKDIRWFVYLPALALLASYVAAGHKENAFYIWFRPFVLWGVALGFTISFGSVLHAFVTSVSGRTRQQIAILLAGIIAGMSPMVGLSILPEMLNGSALVPIGISTTGLIALPLALGYLVQTDRLFDINRAIGRVLSYGLSLCLFLAGYVLLIWAVSTINPTLDLTERFLQISLIFTGLVAITFNRVRGKVHSIIEGRLNKGRYDYAQAASAITTEISSSQVDLEEIARVLASSVGHFLGVSGVCVLLNDEGRRTVAAAYGIYTEDTVEQSGLQIWCNDLDRDHHLPNMAPPEARAAFLIPLFGNARQVGMLIIGRKPSGCQFGVDDIYFLDSVSRQASMAIDKALLLQEARERAAELEKALRRLQEYATLLEARHNVDQAILAAQSPRLIAEVVLEHIRNLVPCEWTFVLLFDVEGSGATVLASHGENGDLLSAGRYMPGVRISYAKLLHKKDKIKVITDVLALPQPPPLVQALIADGARSLLFIPLVSAGELIGFLGLGASVPAAFATEHISIASEITASLAVALEQARLHEQVSLGHKQLQSLSKRVVEVAETERRTIARELHDEVGQVLTGLKLLLEVSEGLPTDAVRSHIGEAKSLAGQLLDKVRDMSLQLRPAILDDLGLLPALLWHCERYATQTGVQVSLEHREVEGQRFSPEIETAAYRIVQEGLTNVARHAGVAEATVRLWANTDMLGLCIEDHGAGFDVQAALASGTSGGLTGIRERASLLGGHLTIESASGIGTRLIVELPQ